MRIAVIGTGYVGLVTGIVLAEIGHHVTCIDIDNRKIELLKEGTSPIYEPGLDDLLQKNIQKQTISFTTNFQVGIKDTEVIIIAVGTPQSETGEANLSFIVQAAEDIAMTIDHDVTIVIKSTVPVGTNDRIENLIRDRISPLISIHLVSNPEFLREGHAIHDSFHGDRIVIGSENPEAGDKIEALFKPLYIPVLRTDRRSAEMIKYAANAFLAVKISYINEIANLCTEIGADISSVADGMGLDQRIGRAFLNAGIGYGGSCFPKDTEAIAYLGKQHGVPLSIVESAIETNNLQRHRLVNKIIQHFDGQIKNKKIAVLGLAFKPDTDDMREAPSLTIIKELKKHGAQVLAYDPIVTNEYSTYNLSSCVNKADALVLVTEWQEFIEADWMEIGSLVKEKVIFDGRNALKVNELQQEGWKYFGIGIERKQVYGFQKN